jgi:hypothetical protein
VRKGRGGLEQVVGYAYGRLEPRDWNSLRDACGVGVDLVVVPALSRVTLNRVTRSWPGQGQFRGVATS